MRPECGKSLNLHGSILEGKSIGFGTPQNQKQKLKGELMIWRTKMQSRIQLKDQHGIFKKKLN